MTFSYLSGIRRTEDEDKIVYGPRQYEDLHAINPPDGSIAHFNTRGLDAAGMLFASVLRQAAQPRALVLGGGSGAACQDIKQVVPGSEVHSVALSPFNPYARVLIVGHETYRIVSGLLGPDVLDTHVADTAFGRHAEQQRKEFQAMPDDQYAIHKQMIIGSEPRTDLAMVVPTSLAEKLHNEGKLRMFGALESPACDRQHIMRFPEEFKSAETFDFVYEDSGPLYYDQEKAGTAEDSTVQAIALLSARGALYSALYQPTGSRAIHLRAALGSHIPADTLFIQGGPNFLAVRGGHPLYPILQRMVADNKSQKDTGVAMLRTKQCVTFLEEAMNAGA